MKKYLGLVMILVLVLTVGCSKEEVKETGKKACCVDSGGVWKDGGCTAPSGVKDLDELYSEANYQECLASLNLKEEKVDKKSCCIDNGGYWRDNKCDVYDGGNFDLEGYEDCIK